MSLTDKLIFRWLPNNILHLGQMFQDVTTSDNEITFVIDKISSSLHLVKLDVVPQIVHLLLISATKVCKRSMSCVIFTNLNVIWREFGLSTILDKLLCTSD